MAQLRQTKADEPSEVSHKLDTVIRLLAAILTKGANKTEAILALGRLQFSPTDIAEIVGVSSHHAAQALYVERKKNIGKKPDVEEQQSGEQEEVIK